MQPKLKTSKQILLVESFILNLSQKKNKKTFTWSQPKAHKDTQTCNTNIQSECRKKELFKNGYKSLELTFLFLSRFTSATLWSTALQTKTAACAPETSWFAWTGRLWWVNPISLLYSSCSRQPNRATSTWLSDARQDTEVRNDADPLPPQCTSLWGKAVLFLRFPLDLFWWKCVSVSVKVTNHQTKTFMACSSGSTISKSVPYQISISIKTCFALRNFHFFSKVVGIF